MTSIAPETISLEQSRQQLRQQSPTQDPLRCTSQSFPHWQTKKTLYQKTKKETQTPPSTSCRGAKHCISSFIAARNDARTWTASWACC